jgi:hypothetical protein
LKKVDADNSEIALEGVVFDLQKKQADVWSEPGTPVTTGADGTATINITEAGDYRLVEKTNPNLGYAAEPVLTVEFTVLSDGTVTNPNYDNETETLTVKNKKEASEQPGPDPAAVVINKVDGNSDPLTGAGFTLTDGGTYSKVLPAEGGEPLSTFAFDNLADGTYTLTESTTPAGYAGLTEPITFTVTEGTVQTDFTPFDGTANTFTVTNTLTPPDPDPLTADAVISGTKKVVTNGSYKPAFNETFAFTLTQVSGPEGAPAVTVPNTSVTATKDGEYEFAFTVPGLVAGGYQFKIAEVAGTAPYWNYSAEEFTVDVTVGEVDGVFKAVTQPGAAERVFENTYSPTPPEFAGWSLWKVDAANPEAALSGAQFTVDGNALPETPGTGAYDLQSFLNEGLNVITEVLPPVNYTGIASPINLAVTVTTEGAVTVNIDHLNGGAPTGVVIDSARKKIIVPNTAMPPVPGDNPPPAEDNPPPAEYTPPFTPPPAATPNPDPTRRPPNPTPSAAPTPTTPPPTATPEPTEAPAPTLEPTPEPTLEPTPTPYASPTPWPLIFPDEPPAELPAEIVAEPETTDPNLQTAAVLPEGLPAAPVPHEGANLGQIDDFTYIEFDDEGIPLGVWTFDPGDPDDPNDDMWVFDEEIPLGMLEMPKTGELPVSAILLTLGLLLLLAAVVFRKKAAK